MSRQRTPLQEINKLLELLADVNDILAQLPPNRHKLQHLQYQRLKDQYVQQVAEQLAHVPQRLVIHRKAKV